MIKSESLKATHAPTNPISTGTNDNVQRIRRTASGEIRNARFTYNFDVYARNVAFSFGQSRPIIPRARRQRPAALCRMSDIPDISRRRTATRRLSRSPRSRDTDVLRQRTVSSTAGRSEDPSATLCPTSGLGASVINATPLTITAAAISIRIVSASSASAQPRNTATTGFT